MTNTTIKIKGTGIRCKGNVQGNYEQVPSTIYSYLELGLISGNELAVYLMLLKNDHNQYGYAFPTTKQLALWTGLSDKTVKQVTKRLEEVGLIKKGKATGYANKNVYYVHLPLEKAMLYKQVPHLVIELDHRERNFQFEAEQDMQRLASYNEQVQSGNEVTDYYKQLEEEAERRMLGKLNKLAKL